jgi:hypothetical protein
MSELKRLPVKYIRDLAKSDYEKEAECYICDSPDELEFHHYYSVSELYKKWLKKNKLKSEDVMDHREAFIEEHHQEMYEHTVTLCSFHHNERLHQIYGRNPTLGTAKKQMRWVEKQRVKNGLV